MSDAWRVASINTFEQVPVATSSGLLRVSAQSAFRSRPDDLRPTLVADDGNTVARFAAIPAPPDSGGVLRAAFSVPADVATPETVFSLEFEDGFVIALPAPTRGASRLNRRVTPAPAASPTVAASAPAPVPPAPEPVSTSQPAIVEPPAAADSSAPADPPAPVDASASEGEERRSDLHTKITELTGELAESRQQQAELRDAAEFGTRARDTILGMLSTAALAHAELQATRDLSLHTAPAAPTPDDGAQAELRQRLTEAEQRLADAEADHAQTRQRLIDTEQRLSEATQQADSAATELADHRDRAQSLEDRVAGAESEARGHLDRLTDAERERDAADEARREAEAAVEPLTAAHTRIEGEMAEVQDQLHKMSLERDELSRQAQAFDGVAVKARERAAEAEAELQRSSGRLSELEVWTAELERRLADATTELAEARATAGADESGDLQVPRVNADGGSPAGPPPTEPPSLPPAHGDTPPAAEGGIARAARAQGPAVRTVSDSQLDEIRRAAFSEAHAQAERDLEDASPTRRS